MDMDDTTHRDNGRHKPDQYKSFHTQWMMPQHQMKDHHTIKLMAIMAERDSAIHSRNLAISEKKAALAERDLAILQRDAAIAERNNAIMERNNAMTSLRHNSCETDMNGPGCTAPPCGMRHINPNYQHLLPNSLSPQFSDVPSSNHIGETFPISATFESAAKDGQVKRPRRESEGRAVQSNKTSKSRRRKTKSGNDLNRQVTIAELHGSEWNKGQEMASGGGGEYLKQVLKQDWKGREDLVGLNQVIFDDSTMPAPVCSCTGRYQQCYKWGNGGWQSACCTTTLSMHPLPVMPNRRHARVGGRKMSGSAFTKLLSRLAAEGHDLSVPLDLKDHWARHGTNRYITIR